MNYLINHCLIDNFDKINNKRYLNVLQHICENAYIRAKIPNANNGRAYMSCLILDEKYYLLQGRL